MIMKKQYSGLIVESIEFKSSDITTYSIPSTCFYIVANTVDYDNRVCTNPYDNTTYRWYGWSDVPEEDE